MCWLVMSVCSTRRQIPGVVERRDVGVELAHLAAPRTDVQVGERLAEVPAHELAALEYGQRFGPGDRNRRSAVAVSVARERRAGIESLREAVVQSGQHDRGEQIRVGVGAGDAVLDAPPSRRPVRNAKRHAAVVDRPARIQRHVGFGLEAAIGIGRRRAHRHRRVDGRDEPADCVPEQRGAGGILGGEHVAALPIDQAHVQVRAAARLVAVGLRHEGRLHPVLERDPTHQPLEADRVVAGGERIRHVMQVHLELTRTVLREHRARGHGLGARRRVDVREQRRVLVQIRHRVDLCPELAPPGERLARRLREALRRALAVDQIELELDGHHRREAEIAEVAQHACEHMARIAVERPPIVLVHADLHLRELRTQPGHGCERTCDRQADAIGVAVVEAEPGGLDRPAAHVEREHRRRQQQAVAAYALELGDGHALAAQDAHQVGQQQIDEAHLGMRRRPGTNLRDVGWLRHVDPKTFRI
jgi:hypothetical protein